MKQYEAVIGLEVHAQLLTKTKLFCGCSASFGGHPNSHTCPVCLGLPGALPVLNAQAVEFAIKAGIASGCSISASSIFARKNYFYPDLPKGYQISQFDLPLCENGKLTFPLKDGQASTVRIKRIHMEDDAGKLLHDSLGQDESLSLVDFNRSGVPLIEIVSEADLRSSEAAGEYLRRWRQLLRYLEICDGNLEEGSMRCDANVSVRLVGEKEFRTKVEIKNINSFRFVQNAIDFEIKRQTVAYENGEKIIQETRLWDSARNITRAMRSKEEAMDYRYFADPDLKPLLVDSATLKKLKGEIPELPLAKQSRFVAKLGLSNYDAEFLTLERATADYFEASLAALAKSKGDPKLSKDIANWMMGDFTKALKDAPKDANVDGFHASKIKPEQLVELLLAIASGKISGKSAKEVFLQMFATGKTATALIGEMGLSQISDSSALRQMVVDILAAHPKEVADYKAGRDKLFGFFVGQVMKVSKGQANPQLVNDLLKELLIG